MAGITPNEGELAALADYLSAGENFTLKLFKSDTTPGESDTAASYTECDFTDYAAKTLTRSVSGSTWSTPASRAPQGGSAESSVAYSQYNPGSPQSWTLGAAQTIYGYILVGATSGKVRHAERFATPRALGSGDVLTLVPTIEQA